MIKLHKDQWSLKHPSCIDCARTDRRHQCKGRCEACYSKWLYYNDPKRKMNMRKALYKWMANNKEKWAIINRRALKKFRDKHKKTTKKH